MSEPRQSYAVVLQSKAQDGTIPAPLGVLSDAEDMVVRAMRRAVCATPSPLLSLSFVGNGWRLYESTAGKWISGGKR